MLKFCIASFALLFFASLTLAAASFTLKDFLHHAWHDELVSYRIKKAEAPHAARLLGPDGKAVPVQVCISGEDAEVAFVVHELPADGTQTYALTEGKDHWPALIQRQHDGLVLDGGTVAAMVPAPGTAKIKAGQTLQEMPAPLLGIRAAGGAWLGAGKLAGNLPVKSMTTTLIAGGPVYAEARTEYELEGGRYAMTVRVIAGQPAVLVSEEFDLPATAVGKCFVQYDLKGHFSPERLAVLGRLWRQRTDRKDVWPYATSQSSSCYDYKLDFDADRREVTVVGYNQWWPDTVRVMTLHGGAAGQALSFFPTRIGAWRNPMGCYLDTRKDGSLMLSLPLYVQPEPWGVDMANPFYTGRQDASWPKTASRRQWAFTLTPEGEAFPSTGQSAVARQVVKYSDLPLDKIKDWTFVWNWDGVKYPRLSLDPDKLDAVRERAKKILGWDNGLRTYYSRPLSYILTGDPMIGEQLLHAHNAKDASWDGALLTLRAYVNNLFDNWGYVGFPSPNNGTPASMLTQFDAAMSVKEATTAEKAEMQEMAAFVAQMVYDPDWHAFGAGWHMGNPNMPPRQEFHLAMAARVLPTHPLAKAWAERGAIEIQRQLAAMVKPSGAYRECPHYNYEAGLLPLLNAAVPLKLEGRYDAFNNPLLQKNVVYLMNILTPPDPRFTSGNRKLRVLPAFGNSSWEFMPLTSWMAFGTMPQHPQFAGEMMWTWEEQGRPAYWTNSQLLTDPAIESRQPELKSALFEGFGAVLRSGFPSKDETWMAFRHGNCIEHYNTGDEGSFMLYAKGAPLVLHIGSQYQPYYHGPWYFNTACFNHRPVSPESDAANIIRSYALDPANYCLGTAAVEEEKPDFGSYVMKNRGFFTGVQADYARGEQIQTAQMVEGKDVTQKSPSNTRLGVVTIPETHWNRRVALLKDADPLAPNYFVMRDDLLGKGNFPGEWNIWTLAQQVTFNGNQALVTSKYGVLMDVFLAEPLQPQWSTRQESYTFLAGPSQQYRAEKKGPWQETMTNLRAEQGPNKGFLAVLFPRKADQPAAICTTLADGKGVKVVTTRGTDWVFLSEIPLKWNGDGLSFSGTAGAIRQAGDRWTVDFFEPGEATVNGKTMKAEAPVEMTAL